MDEAPNVEDEPIHRNVSNTCSDVFLEKLIEAVKKNPCLYNLHSLQYRDTLAKERCWNEISKHSNRHSSGLKKEWKKLRDCYRQALVTRSRNDPKKKHLKPWKFEKQMEFLKPYIMPRSRHLDGSQTSSENEFDQNNVMVKQERLSDDDNTDMTPPQSSTLKTQVMTPKRLLRNRVGAMQPTPSSKPPRKRNKKEKSPASPRYLLFDSPTAILADACETNNSSKPSTSSQDNEPPISCPTTCDMYVETDSQQDQKPIIADIFPSSTSLANPRSLSFDTPTRTLTDAGETDNIPKPSTSCQGNETLTSTPSPYDMSVETDSHHKEKYIITTSHTPNSTQPKTSSPIATNILEKNLASAATSLGCNTSPTITTTLGNNIVPTVTTVQENNSLQNVTTTLPNSTNKNNSLPINTSTNGDNVILTTTSTLGNGSRINYSFPINVNKLGINTLPQSNSALGSSSIAYLPIVGNFGNNNNTHSISTGPLANSNVQPYNVLRGLNTFVDSTGQLHNVILPVPINTGNSSIEASLSNSVFKSNSCPPAYSNIGNNKTQKSLTFSQLVDMVGKFNKCQFYKVTPTVAVDRKNIQQKNGMDSSIPCNSGNKNNDNLNSISAGSSNYNSSYTDKLTGNASTQTDATVGRKNLLESSDCHGDNDKLPSAESLAGNISNKCPQSVSHGDHPQCTSNTKNDNLTPDGTLSIQNFSVSTQTTSAISNSQVRNLMPSSIGNCNDSHEHSDLQLFFASMYESTKKLPANHQMTIKKNLFESVLTAEKEHYTSKEA